MLSKRGSEKIAQSMLDADTAKLEPGVVKKSPKEKKDELALNASLVQELFKSLPYAVSLHMIGSDFGIWSSLRVDGLAVTVDDLLLKHGGCPSGDWNMLGIVDALPNTTPSQVDPYFEEGSTTNPIAELLTNLRPKFGRPDKAFGMTPLLIFREVSV